MVDARKIVLLEQARLVVRESLFCDTQTHLRLLYLRQVHQPILFLAATESIYSLAAAPLPSEAKMEKRSNGGIVGVYNPTSASSAVGIWSLSEQEANKATWPPLVNAPPTVEYLVVAGGGGNITGTAVAAAVLVLAAIKRRRGTRSL